MESELFTAEARVAAALYYRLLREVFQMVSQGVAVDNIRAHITNDLETTRLDVLGEARGFKDNLVFFTGDRVFVPEQRTHRQADGTFVVRHGKANATDLLNAHVDTFVTL